MLNVDCITLKLQRLCSSLRTYKHSDILHTNSRDTQGLSQPLKTGSIYTYRDPVIILNFAPRVKICSTKHLDAWRIISPSGEPTNSHQVGLQNKFRFHVHRIRSGLFYDNSTELDEVDEPIEIFHRQ